MTHKVPGGKDQTLTAGRWDTGYPLRTVSSLLLQIKTTAAQQEKQEAGFQIHQNNSPSVPSSWQEAATACGGCLEANSQQASLGKPQAVLGQEGSLFL